MEEAITGNDEEKDVGRTPTLRFSGVVIHVIHTTFIVGSLRISRRRTRKK
jgi:hypothetical protein